MAIEEGQTYIDDETGREWYVNDTWGEGYFELIEVRPDLEVLRVAGIDILSDFTPIS